MPSWERFSREPASPWRFECVTSSEGDSVVPVSTGERHPLAVSGSPTSCHEQRGGPSLNRRFFPQFLQLSFPDRGVLADLSEKTLLFQSFTQGKKLSSATACASVLSSGGMGEHNFSLENFIPSYYFV